jgi:hypothetical protein
MADPTPERRTVGYNPSPMSDPIPTAKDVVAFLNDRFAARGLPYRIEQIAVLPYVNPMWLSNWDVPQLTDAPEREVIEEELREARWRFPQVTSEC